MGASFFQFKQFTIHQERCSMKVTTDACLFGAWVADKIQNDGSVKNILDIGSGTGLLSLMLAQKTTAAIDAIELQEKDYLQSLENVAGSPWKDRANIIHADATNYRFNKKYDVIISNPPFYENDLKSDDSGKNVAHHDAGLDLKTLIKIVVQNLQPEGKFFLLLPAKRKAELFKYFENTHLCINQVTPAFQTEKHDNPFRILTEIGYTKPTTKPTISSGNITIKVNGNYSQAFSFLLKDYYLHF